MKIFLISILLLCFSLAKAQGGNSDEEPSEFEIIKPSPSSVVSQHKEKLQLTLIIDSIQVQNKTIRPNFRKTFDIGFESDYIQVNDSLYIKIFIARNQEYGLKFYSWKWEYLKKRNTTFSSLGISFYNDMDYNGSLDANGGMGHGVGIEGTKGYIMYYYRYNLK